jgi:hypothetical protein
LDLLQKATELAAVHLFQRAHRGAPERRKTPAPH